jgi:hypothetical protein
MDNGKFASQSCADDVMRTVGVDATKVKDCMGDASSNTKNEMLERQIAAQDVDRVMLLPTIMINGVRYSGKLARGEILSAICAGFSEDSIPSMCSDAGLMHAMCVRGQEGDQTCEANAQTSGLTKCVETASFPYYQCTCPEGHKAVVGPNGVTKCQELNCDIKCKGPNTICTNAVHGAGYNCTCISGYVATYQPDPVDDWACLSNQHHSSIALVLTSVAMSILAVSCAGYAFYQYRARSYMDKDIRNIMMQYMPLDTEAPEGDDSDAPYERPPDQDARRRDTARGGLADTMGARILPSEIPLSDF